MKEQLRDSTRFKALVIGVLTSALLFVVPMETWEQLPFTPKEAAQIIGGWVSLFIGQRTLRNHAGTEAGADA